jgi:GMP synthase (glutamine-hydrolysing)
MKILMLEGNLLSVQKKAATIGVTNASDVYTKAVRLFDKDISIDIVNAADNQIIPNNHQLNDYDGMIISGSSLRAFEQTYEVLNQIDLLKQFAQTGKPILGSCWGLQIAAIAAGGSVGPSPNGRELGIARKIVKTAAGRSHPFLAGKPDTYDAPCIHYDEVITLPDNATLLSSNAHSEVQAAIIPLANSEVWGVQYHPEFDINQLRKLFELYKNDMLRQGFVENELQHSTLLSQYQALHDNPQNKALAWQIGMDKDITEDSIRAVEIANWLKLLY